MPINPDASHANGKLPDLPIIEVILEVGDSVRIGNRVLRILDIDGDSSMLRVDSVADQLEDSDNGRWSELPR